MSSIGNVDAVEVTLGGIHEVRCAHSLPKDATTDDFCLLSHAGLGIFAYGTLQGDAKPDQEVARRYRAPLGQIEVLGQMIPHSVLARLWPSWGWPTYPRSYTTIVDELEDELLELVEDFEEPPSEEADESVALEGAAFLRLHQVRERDQDLAQRKRQRVLRETGRLACAVCDFDFAKFYGRHGEGFAEVHHARPIGARNEAEATTMDQLEVVCANCHRMLHRRGLIDSPTIKAIISANAA